MSERVSRSKISDGFIQLIASNRWYHVNDKLKELGLNSRDNSSLAMFSAKNAVDIDRQILDDGKAVTAQLTAIFNERGAKSSELKLYKEMIKSGASKDKVSAYTVLITQAPFICAPYLDGILHLCTNGVREQKILTATKLFDVFEKYLIPPRKLYFSVDNPLKRGMVTKVGSGHKYGGKIGQCLLIYMEDMVKAKFIHLLECIHKLLRDSVENTRLRAAMLLRRVLDSTCEQREMIMNILMTEVVNDKSAIVYRHVRGILHDVCTKEPDYFFKLMPYIETQLLNNKLSPKGMRRMLDVIGTLNYHKRTDDMKRAACLFYLRFLETIHKVVERSIYIEKAEKKKVKKMNPNMRRRLIKKGVIEAPSKSVSTKFDVKDYMTMERVRNSILGGLDRLLRANEDKPFLRPSDTKRAHYSIIMGMYPILKEYPVSAIHHLCVINSLRRSIDSLPKIYSSHPLPTLLHRLDCLHAKNRKIYSKELRNILISEPVSGRAVQLWLRYYATCVVEGSEENIKRALYLYKKVALKRKAFLRNMPRMAKLDKVKLSLEVRNATKDPEKEVKTEDGVKEESPVVDKSYKCSEPGSDKKLKRSRPPSSSLYDGPPLKQQCVEESEVKKEMRTERFRVWTSHLQTVHIDPSVAKGLTYHLAKRISVKRKPV